MKNIQEQIEELRKYIHDGVEWRVAETQKKVGIWRRDTDKELKSLRADLTALSERVKNLEIDYGTSGVGAEIALERGKYVHLYSAGEDDTPPQPTAAEGDEAKWEAVSEALGTTFWHTYNVANQTSSPTLDAELDAAHVAVAKAIELGLAARPVSTDDEGILQIIGDEVEAAIGIPSGRSHQAARQILRDIVAAQQEVNHAQ